MQNILVLKLNHDVPKLVTYMVMIPANKEDKNLDSIILTSN